MTSRHPNGGSVHMTKAVIGMLGACVVIPLALSGCGGGCDSNEPSPFPRYHYVNIVLNVSDLGGNAIGGVTVWVSGVAQGEKTSWTFVVLGDGYPDSWRGFHANWIKGGFTVATYDYDDIAVIEVIVSKAGYYSQATDFEIHDSLPSEVYARDTFIMERNPYPATAEKQEPRKKPEPGEVTGMDGETTSMRVPARGKLVRSDGLGGWSVSGMLS